MEISGEYKDELMSGKEAENRLEFQKAIKQACKDKAVVVVYSLDRFGRDVIDNLTYIDKLTAAKAGFASITEQFDTTTPIGRYFQTQLAAFAEYARRQSNQRTSDAMRHYQASGIRMGKIPPYGWKVDPDNDKLLIEDEYEQGLISRMIELRRSGTKLRVISKMLWREGLHGRRSPIYRTEQVVKWGKERKVKTDEIIGYGIGIIGHNVIKAILNRAGVE